MKIFINPDGRAIVTTQDDTKIHPSGCNVFFCGVKIYGVVFVDTEINFVRVSIPPEKTKTFENAAKPLFKNFKRIGTYESGSTGYEFTVPNLEIKFL